MIVGWNWLQNYVNLTKSRGELTDLLTMSGLNLEGLIARNLQGVVVEDATDCEERNDLLWSIDLEVTSNRPDCLGHIGVAREISVLTGEPLKIPEPNPRENHATPRESWTLTIDDTTRCPRYVGRIIRGVTVKASPDWLQQKLLAVGVTPVNNIVDLTNYVMLECGQPMHAFDLAKLHGRTVHVRNANPGEQLEAINHKTYELMPEMLVIADAERPVAIAGVMGGAETEIQADTTDVFIETADFDPLCVRSTARALKLHSDSSFRFERRIDREQIDWASRRCCELILELAGGELEQPALIAGVDQPQKAPRIELRFARIERLLGIPIPAETAMKILKDLGLSSHDITSTSAVFTPPSWRSDLTREVDLIEEVARIYGYDKIPATAVIPVAASAPSPRERTNDRIRDFATAVGFHEAITLSLVSSESLDWFRPRGTHPPITVDSNSTRQLNTLRQSLIPSLLLCRRDNERQGTFQADLFEIAKVYLQANPNAAERESEPLALGFVTGRSFLAMKGLLQELAHRFLKGTRIECRPSDLAEFAPGRGAEVYIEDRLWGWLGELNTQVLEAIGLQNPTTIAEVSPDWLEDHFVLAPQADELPVFPAIERDLNFILDETTPWSELESVVRKHAGELLEDVNCVDRYRGKQLGANKKSYVIRMTLRGSDRTLTGQEVEPIQARVVSAVEQQLGAQLRS